MSDNIPLLGRKPEIRMVKTRINDFILNDPDGSATLSPVDDLTPIEGYQLGQLMLWCAMQPQGVVGDPQTQGRTGMQFYTLWREFITEKGLERHFSFSPHRMDGPIEGRG